MSRPKLRIAVVALVVAGSVGAFALGRHTAPAPDGTSTASYKLGYDEGVSVGRALQAGASLPSGTRDVATKAFQSGYRSGLADSFGGYDGGWNLGQPYAVVIGKGSGDATYRIDSRELLRAGVTYQLCKHDTAVCPK
jgi:hypothetical protein